MRFPDAIIKLIFFNQIRKLYFLTYANDIEKIASVLLCILNAPFDYLCGLTDN